MTERFIHLRSELEAEMDLDAIWEREYKAVLAEELADEVRQKARTQAEADLRRRHASERNADKG